VVLEPSTADLEGATVTGEFEDYVIQQAAIKDAIEAAGFDVTA
jgi:copper chaperone CopZ